MKPLACLLVISSYLLALSLPAQTSETQTVKAWTRTHVIGLAGGTLRDPTGTIADAQRLAAASASADSSSILVAAADAGLSNALARLYAETNRIAGFSGRIYLAADMDDDPGYSNVWSAVVGESVEADGTPHYYCHYSRALSAPPGTRWAFSTAPGTTLWAEGQAATNNATTNVNGYANCYDIRVPLPGGVGNSVLRAEKFMVNGAAGFPLDIDDAGIRVITGAATNTAYTGAVTYTNAVPGLTNRITETYLAGTLYTVTTNTVP